MPQLTLNAQTSVSQLEAFARAAGSAEIRAKTDQNGVTTLYTHSKWKLSLNSNPQARAEKQMAGRTAIAGFLASKLSIADMPTLIGSMAMADVGSKAIKGSTVADLAKETKPITKESKANNFHTAMKIPSMRAAFTQFLEGEYSAENIHFLNRVEDFQKMAKFADTPEKLAAVRAEARVLMHNFVRENADEQINVSSTQRGNLERAAENLDGMDKDQLHAFFDESQREVSKLVMQDGFPRFQKSDLFKQGLAAIL